MSATFLPTNCRDVRISKQLPDILLICTPFYDDQKIQRKWKPGPQRHAVDNPLVTKDKFCYDKTIWYLVILKTSTVVRSALAAAFGRSVISLCGGGKKKIRGEGKRQRQNYWTKCHINDTLSWRTLLKIIIQQLSYSCGLAGQKKISDTTLEKTFL